MLPSPSASQNIPSIVEAAFKEDVSKSLYNTVLQALLADVRKVPGVGVAHALLVERMAYVHAKSIEVGRNPDMPYQVEKAYLDAFGRLLMELGRETRTMMREELFKGALVDKVIDALNDELRSQPDTLKSLASRLRAITGEGGNGH